MRLSGAFAALAAAALALPHPAQAQPADPALEAQFCGEVRQYMNWTNANIDAGMANGQPITLDDLGRLDLVGLDCDARTVPFRLTVGVPDSEAERSERREAWNARWCVPWNLARGDRCRVAGHRHDQLCRRRPLRYYGRLRLGPRGTAFVNLTSSRKDEFLDVLKGVGGRSGNRALREKLDWPEDFYSKVQRALVADGRIRSGPGRGGTVHIAEETPDTSAVVETMAPGRVNERDLYVPIRAQIEARWISSTGYESYIIEETYSQGSRSTGGTYSRPDITVIGVRKFLFLPTMIEAATFEIKANDAINVHGILEALTHRESVHKAYTIFHISPDEFNASVEADRISSLARRHGIGLILADDPADYDTWDIRLEAQRTNPDPDRLDAFINGLADSGKKQKLQKALK